MSRNHPHLIVSINSGLMQYHLLKTGNALGYDVIAASNDRSKSHCGNSFSFMSLQQFPEINLDKDTLNAVKLIDVLWFQKGTNNVIAAFEMEKRTSIYSGILRPMDLSYSIADGDEVFYLIVPDKREKDVCLHYFVPPLSKIMWPSGILSSQTSALIVMPCAGLEIAIILWRKLANQYKPVFRIIYIYKTLRIV